MLNLAGQHIHIPLPSDPALITAIFAGVGLVIAAIIRGVFQVRRELKTATQPIIDEQIKSNQLAVCRDVRIEDIHMLVNSRLIVVTQLLVSTLRKEALRTNAQEDIDAYNQAVLELEELESAAREETNRKLLEKKETKE